MDNGFKYWKTQYRDEYWIPVLEDTAQGCIMDSNTGRHNPGVDNGFQDWKTQLRDG